MIDIERPPALASHAGNHPGHQCDPSGPFIEGVAQLRFGPDHGIGTKLPAIGTPVHQQIVKDVPRQFRQR